MNYIINTVSMVMIMIAAVVVSGWSPAGGAPKAGKDAVKRTVCLIIDIQNDYFPRGKFELLNPEKAAVNAKLLLAHFRKNNIPVIHIRHENIRPGVDFFIPGTPGAAIHSLVAPVKGEAVILKHMPSSFIGTVLEAELRRKKTGNLLIIGMQSNVCVISTALDAVRKGYPVTVVEDAIAARSKEVHDRAIEEMRGKGISIVTTGSIVKNK